MLGRGLGTIVGKRAEMAGGLILIIIDTLILVEHFEPEPVGIVSGNRHNGFAAKPRDFELTTTDVPTSGAQSKNKSTGSLAAAG